MADQDLRAAMRPSRWRFGAVSFDFSHIIGAVLAVAVVGGSGAWFSNLVSRDVSGVPVVLALNGVVPSPGDVRVASLPETDDEAEEEALIAALDKRGDLDQQLEGAAFTSANRGAGSTPVAPSRIEAPAPLDLRSAVVAPAIAPVVADELEEKAARAYTGSAVAVSPRPVRRPVVAAATPAQPRTATSEPAPLSEEDKTRRAILDALQGQASLEVIGDDEELPLTNIAFTNADPTDAAQTRPMPVQPEASSFRILPAVASAEPDQSRPAEAIELALASAETQDLSGQHAGPADLVCIPKDVVESY